MLIEIKSRVAKKGKEFSGWKLKLNIFTVLFDFI